MKMARVLLHRGHHRWAIALLFASALLLMGAAGDTNGRRFDRLGHNLMCECGCGQILLECNHVGCTTSEGMRKELKFALDRGDTDDQVVAAFVSKYGPVVLASPTHTGFNRVAWITPVVIFFAALAGVVLFIRAWQRHSPTPPSDSTGSTPGELDEFRRRAREETSL
jgi:cytochrome c-type biogenesis protein CcmH